MERTILDFLEKSAARYPNKAAVIEEDKSLSYLELVNRSKKIGSGLARVLSPQMPVGVYMEKGIDAMCCFFGIVYAGGCYSMMNPELPDARLVQIQDVLQTNTIVCADNLKDRAKQLFPGVQVYTVQELQKNEIDACLLGNIRDSAIDTDPLYINFTSGSTGTPKGIVVAHRSVIDFISVFTSIFCISESDIIANQAPFDFDVSVKDIYSAIKVGATLVVVPRRLFSSPTQLIDYLCDHRVTTMIWAVSALCLISTFHALEYKTPKTVSKILFSGEVMPYKHLCEWQKHIPDAMYVNLYGPTEITCNCTYYILQPGIDYSKGIPIGKPFPNEDVFLLSKDNKKITETGVKGNIAVRGTALALGYYRVPEKNEKSFIQNPLNDAYPERVYMTGDLGMYDADKNLIFCGRSDNQIKYMGHRIELEEIERVMSAIEGVDRCFCFFDEKKSSLKGFYVGSIEKKELHTLMRKTLPVFMIPGFLRKLDEMPMTKNGKIDRKKAIQMIGGQYAVPK